MIEEIRWQKLLVRTLKKLGCSKVNLEELSADSQGVFQHSLISAGNTQLVLTLCHKEVVFWFSGIFIQVVSMAFYCFLVTVADTLHHYYLVPPCHKALLCLAWCKGDPVCPGRFAICVLRGKKGVILGYVTEPSRSPWWITKRRLFLLIRHRGILQWWALPQDPHCRGRGEMDVPQEVTVVSPGRMSPHTAACIPNSLTEMSCLHVFRRRQLQTTCQRDGCRESKDI